MPEAFIEIEAEDGGLDAFLARPETRSPRPPVLLLADRQGLRPAFQAKARRLAAHGYVVLAPDWTARPADERREDVEAWFDHLAGDRGVDDARVGVVGYGAGADLALQVAAWRAERVAVVGAYLGRGFAPGAAADIAQRINGLIHLGYAEDRLPGLGLCALETALRQSGVDFEAECYPVDPSQDPSLDETHWLRLLDLFARTLIRRRPGTATDATDSSVHR